MDLYGLALAKGVSWIYDRPVENGEPLAGMLYFGAFVWYFRERPPFWWRLLVFLHPRLVWEPYDGHTIHRIGGVPKGGV